MLDRIRPAARLLALSALLVGGAVAAACGDDDDNASPTSAAATTAAPTKAESPAAQATATKAASPAASATTGGAATAKTVTIADNTFSPGNLTVAKGTKVTWNWTGQNPHSVVGTSDNAKSIKSDQHKGSGTFEFTFDTPGTYQYQCGVHGAAMTGTITVQ